MKIIIWIDEKHYHNETIQRLLTAYRIAPLIAGNDMGKSLWLKMMRPFTFTEYTFAYQNLPRYIDEPITENLEFAVDGRVPLISGESSLTNIKRLVDNGVTDITYTSYGEYLFGFNLPDWNILGKLKNKRINIRSWRNQIPTWRKMIKLYNKNGVRKFNHCWVSLWKNKGDYRELIEFCRYNSKNILLVSSVKQSQEDLIIELTNFCEAYLTEIT